MSNFYSILLSFHFYLCSLFFFFGCYYYFDYYYDHYEFSAGLFNDLVMVGFRKVTEDTLHFGSATTKNGLQTQKNGLRKKGR